MPDDIGVMQGIDFDSMDPTAGGLATETLGDTALLHVFLGNEHGSVHGTASLDREQVRDAMTMFSIAFERMEAYEREHDTAGES